MKRLLIIFFGLLAACSAFAQGPYKWIDLDAFNLSTYRNGRMWHYNDHIYARLNGVTYQLDQQNGSLTSTYVGYGNGSNVLTGESTFTYDASSDLLSVGSIVTPNLTSITGDLTLNATDEVVLTASNDVRIIPSDDLILVPTDDIVIASTLVTDNTNTNLLSVDAVTGNIEVVQKSSIVTSPSGSNTQIQFNNSGSFAGDADLTFTGGNTLNATNLTISQGAITSGTYTPTFTNISNLDGSAIVGTTWSYARIGDFVIVQGAVNMDATVMSTITQMGISLPFSSNLANIGSLSGSGVNSFDATSVNMAAEIIGDSTNDRANIAFYSFSTSNIPIHVTFMYRIIP